MTPQKIKRFFQSLVEYALLALGGAAIIEALITDKAVETNIATTAHERLALCVGGLALMIHVFKAWDRSE